MFKKGKSYRRLDIHEQYGGRQQSGISNCPKYPYIFIWTKRKEEQDVYEDKWEDNYYLYSGEGRIGDHKFTGGNKSIRDHKIDGKTIFLFEKDYKKSGYWIFINEMSLKGCFNYKNHDELGNIRTCIRFQLKPLDQVSVIKKKDNPNIFIFTAGDKNARAHLDYSVNNRIRYNTIKKHINTRLGTNIKLSDGISGGTRRLIDSLGVRLMSDGPQEFYAWGAIKGPNNIRNWNKIRKGDWVLCVYDNKYQYISKITDKVHNKGLATDIWGTNEKGDTWEYMYFFERPNKIELFLNEIPSEYMYSKYLGFTSISDERIDNINTDFLSIEKFIQKYFSNYDKSFIVGSADTRLLRLLKDVDKEKKEDVESINIKEQKTRTKYKKFTKHEENSLIYNTMPNQNNNSSIEFNAQHTKMSNSFFDVQKRFRIPRYQRPYSWEKAQVEELWSDLIKHNIGSFFIGSVIFNKRLENSHDIIDIIDGQQRFLTLTILVRALLNQLSELESNSDNLDTLLQQSLRFTSSDGDGWIRRLVPGKSLENFFNDYIIDGERVHDDNISSNITQSIQELKSVNNNFQTKITKEEIRVISTYNVFIKKISELLDTCSSNSEKRNKIIEINKRIKNLVIVEMNVLDENVAYEIFESTNARGLDLSIADLLKNYIFRSIDQNHETFLQAESYWNEMVENIDSSGDELKKFIRYYWLSKYQFLQYKPLFKGIKEYTDGSHETITIPLMDLLKDLKNSSKWYKGLSVENSEYLSSLLDSYNHKDRILKSIKHLRTMGISQANVFLMSLLRNKHHVSFYNPVTVIKAIEHFSFMHHAVCKQRANTVERMYSNYARELEDACKTPSNRRQSQISRVFDRLKAKLNSMKPSEEFFYDQFKEIEYSESGSNRLIRYILTKYSEFLSNRDQQEIDTDFEAMTIEHILPKDSEEYWNIPNDRYSNSRNKLGNLTILTQTDNGSAGNMLLENKIATYESSSLHINRKLQEEIAQICGLIPDSSLWDENVMNERLETISSNAYIEVWKIS